MIYRVGRQLYRLEPNPPNTRPCVRCAFRFESTMRGKCSKFTPCESGNAVARRIPKTLPIPASVTIVECR